MSAPRSHAERLLFERIKPRGPWATIGLCAQSDTPDLWFSDAANHNATRAAKAICAECPARKPCQTWAIESREPFGVWGGLSEQDRARLRGAK